MKRKDIAITLEIDPSLVSRILSKERRITHSISVTLKSILGGTLEDYLYKKGSDAAVIFSQLNNTNQEQQKKEVNLGENYNV